MNKLLIKFLLLGLLFTQTVWAVDAKQIHARNEAAEQGLMNLRIEQAKAILAGTDAQVSWSNKIVQLKGSVGDINTYATGQANSNWQLSIDASQQLIKELAKKYSKKVYGDKTTAKEQQDPLLNNFRSSFKILKRMEKHPEQHAVLYTKLQEQMTELDSQINNRTAGVNP